MATSFEQVVAVTAMNLRNLPARWASSLVAIVGVSGVTLVLVAVLSIAEGFRAALEMSGSDDVAIALRSGSTDELTSGITQDLIPIVGDAPGVLRTSGRQSVISPELYVVVDAPIRGKQSSANVPFRGVGPFAPVIRKQFRMIEGRMFEPGTNEIVVGRGAALQYDGLTVGREVSWGPGRWTIVGVFTDGGGVAESEVWGDSRVVQQAYNRGSIYQSIRVKLQSASAFDAFKDAVSRDPRVNARIERESVFYAEQQQFLQVLVGTAGWTLAIMMGLGAVFAALNTMYNAVADRVREIATLRAMGFGASPVVISVLAEALILGAIGGLLGGILAYLFLNGMRSSTLNWQNFSQITFAFTVTPGLVATGIIYGLVLTTIGGLVPGIRAARAPIIAGLRAG
jgi:putative ABC transport system permease protein